MYCTKCGAVNPDDHKYCSECGTKLVAPKVPPPAEPERPTGAEQQATDQEKVGELLFKAFQQYETGHLDEALKSCEEAGKLNPSSTSVHSLLSLIHEKQGDLERAIVEVSRVLEINPSSAADQERMDQLRRRLYAEPEPPTPMGQLRERLRRIPQGALIAGAGAFVVVFLLVVFWPKQPAATTETTQPPVTVPGAVQPQAPQSPYATSPPASEAYSYAQPAPAVSPPQPPASRAEEPAVEGGTPQAGAARPVGAASPPQAFPEVKVEPRKPTSEGPTPGPAPRSTAPRIEIVTTPRKTPPGFEGAVKRVESSTLLAQARQAQSAGKYDEAIRNYQQALPSASNTGPIHQMIGFCYYRSGKNDQAANSYRAAIDAYKKQIAAGADVDAARRGLSAAEAGLKLVEGAD